MPHAFIVCTSGFCRKCFLNSGGSAVAANTLAEALNLFDPRRQMRVEELDAYYVKRPHAALDPMKTYLRVSSQPVKILFSGHRGCGKSTELLRLAKDLEDQFFVVHVSARSLNLADLNYVDVALSCAAALFREATNKARKVRIPAALWREVLNFLTNEITTETTINVPQSGSVTGKINALIFSIEGKYGKETATRDTMRQRLYPRVNDLIQQANAVCEEIHRVTGRPPLIIFEDIDKTDLATARNLFFEHATTLNSSACRIIYTFPIALCYANEFTQRLGDYNKHFLLPNVSLSDPHGVSNADGLRALREVITRRVSEEIFDGAALDRIIESSGGLMRDLVRMVGDAALIALTDGAPKIGSRIVEQVASDMRNDFRHLLLPEHYAALREIQQTRQITPNETARQCLENLSLLEYSNAVAWGDVHPIVKPLL